MNLEPKARAFVEMLRSVGAPQMWTLPPHEARAAARALRKPTAPRVMHAVTDHAIRRDDAPDLALRLYVPAAEVDSIIVYFHGGGWTVGGIEESDGFARELAARAESAVVSVDYRLAPENPFPAALHDGLDALSWCMARCGDLLGREVPVIVAGDSAGANIATAATRLAMLRGDELPALQVLAYPVTDSRMETASYRTFGDGPLLSRRLMEWFWSNYVPDAGLRSDPRISCAHAGDLAGMPPTFVLTAENDVLRDEGEAYATAMANAGVPVRLKRYAGQIHGFLTLVGMFDGGAEALRDIGDFIGERLGRTGRKRA